MELVDAMPDSGKTSYAKQYLFIDSMEEGQIARFSRGKDFYTTPTNFAQAVKHHYMSNGSDILLNAVVRKDDVFVEIIKWGEEWDADD